MICGHKRESGASKGGGGLEGGLGPGTID